MIYFTRITDIIKAKIFKKLTHKNHVELQKQNGYFAVFLNDSVSDSVQTSGLYEKEILVPLFKILNSKYDFSSLLAIDAGANIGNHTLFFKQYFKKVFAFEPNPITFKLLEVNTFFHNKEITVFNLGLSDKEESINLSVLEGNIGGSSAVTDYKGRIYQKINVVKIDDFLDPSKHKIGLIKIDVEGMEFNVLRGAENIISLHKPIILFELWKSSFNNGTNDSIDFLRALGYKIYTLNESNFSKNTIIRRLKRLKLVLTKSSLMYELLENPIISSGNYAMLVALPTE